MNLHTQPRTSLTRFGIAALLCAAATATTGCGVSSSTDFAGAPGAEFGATQGGTQDMQFARDLIAEGRVPPAEAFLVEAMFSEHDLPVAGDACDSMLCLRSSLAVAPALDGTPTGWLQVGMSSTIDPATFERPSLTIVATVDVSGSMGWGYADDQVSAGSLTRNLLGALVDQLGPEDRIAIVTYGSRVDTALTLRSAGQKDEIHTAIDKLSEAGSTNMEAGLQRAYAIASEAAADGETDSTRIMLFTDVQPNVGATGASQFEAMASEGADSGVGLTVFGLGLGLGQELMTAMSHQRGGNAFSLTRHESVGELIEDDWPWLASPIAYDLEVALAAPEGLSIRESYGFPEGSEESAGFEVSTVFLSKRKGALLISLQPGDAASEEDGTEGDGADAGEGEDAASALDSFAVSGLLRYTTPAGEPVENTLSASYAGEALDARGHYYQQTATGKTVALALLVSGMHEAAELYENQPEQAVAHLEAVYQRFAADAESLGDAALEREQDLAGDLLELMKSGAEQGSLYGYY